MWRKKGVQKVVGKLFLITSRLFEFLLGKGIKIWNLDRKNTWRDYAKKVVINKAFDTTYPSKLLKNFWLWFSRDFWELQKFSYPGPCFHFISLLTYSLIWNNQYAFISDHTTTEAVFSKRNSSFEHFFVQIQEAVSKTDRAALYSKQKHPSMLFFCFPVFPESPLTSRICALIPVLLGCEGFVWTRVSSGAKARPVMNDHGCIFIETRENIIKFKNWVRKVNFCLSQQFFYRNYMRIQMLPHRSLSVSWKSCQYLSKKSF